MGLFSSKLRLDFEGVFFDLHGVVFASEQWLTRAWWNVLARRGLRIQDYQSEMHAGRSDPEYFHIAMRYFGINEPPNLFAEEWYREAESLLLKHVKPVAGIEKLLKEMQKQNLQMTLVTSMSRKFVERILMVRGLLKYFHVLVSKESFLRDNFRGRPAPDAYLFGAHFMKIQPSRCITFESTVNGVFAAKSAGIRTVVGVLDPTHMNAQKMLVSGAACRVAGADWIFEALTEFSLRNYANVL